MRVNKNTLLLLAASIWSIAGLNIFNIGYSYYISYLNIINIAVSTIIFFLFTKFVFMKLVNKHTQRILNYVDTMQPFYNFFDIQSFIIMTFMIVLGLTLRSLPFISKQFIAIFYCGLGAALLLAGLLFARNYLLTKQKERD